MPDVTLKTEYLNPFIRSTIETFSTMANMKVAAGRVRVKDRLTLSYDVSGIVGLSGGAKGTVALSFPRASALSVVRAFIGEKSVSTAKLIDAVGELTNIVTGAAKRDLAAFKIKISLPTVVTGEGHSISGPVDSSSMVVPFEFPGGKFDLAVCFKSLI